MNVRKGVLLGPLMAAAARLRFPVLFAITAVLFLVDLVVPDFLPMVDELLLGLAAVLLASWRKRRTPPTDEPRTEQRATEQRGR